MLRLDEALERLKTMECPTGGVEERILETLVEFNIAKRNDISITHDQDDEFINNNIEAYRAKFRGNKAQTVVVLCRSGIDDYVSKVLDAYVQ